MPGLCRRLRSRSATPAARPSGPSTRVSPVALLLISRLWPPRKSPQSRPLGMSKADGSSGSVVEFIPSHRTNWMHWDVFASCRKSLQGFMSEGKAPSPSMECATIWEPVKYPESCERLGGSQRSARLRVHSYIEAIPSSTEIFGFQSSKLAAFAIFATNTS